jgi:hypothetical protein
LERWVSKYLRPTDEVVIEVGTDTRTIHDRLSPLVSRMVVAHPFYVKFIAAAVVKTDKRDTLAK